MSTTTDKDFVSIGALASHVQRSVQVIERVAGELNIQPAMRLNRIPYFDGEQVERLTSHLHSDSKGRA